MRQLLESHRVLNLALIVLAVIALVLGYLVYLKLTGGSLPSLSLNRDTSLSEERSGAVPDFSSLSDIDLIMSLPHPDQVTPEVMQAYAIEMNNRAEDTTQIRIRERCEAQPQIAGLFLGDTVSFTNDDAAAHTVRVTPERALELAPGGSEDIVVDFPTGKGMYVYLCDDSSTPSGILLVR